MCKYPTVEHGSKKMDVQKVVTFEIKREKNGEINNFCIAKGKLAWIFLRTSD